LTTRALLIEDHAVFLGILLRFFKEELSEFVVSGFARTAEYGLALAGELRPDVVTVDLMLPDMSGLDLIGRLRRLLPQTGIVVVTQHDDESFRVAARQAGADAFVCKDHLPVELPHALRRAASRGGTRETPHTSTEPVKEHP